MQLANSGLAVLLKIREISVTANRIYRRKKYIVRKHRLSDYRRREFNSTEQSLSVRTTFCMGGIGDDLSDSIGVVLYYRKN